MDIRATFLSRGIAARISGVRTPDSVYAHGCDRLEYGPFDDQHPDPCRLGKVGGFYRGRTPFICLVAFVTHITVRWGEGGEDKSKVQGSSDSGAHVMIFTRSE